MALIRNPDDDHADIARTFLATKGIAAKDYLDLYTQMFALGFARATEEGTQLHIESPSGFSRAQEDVIKAKALAKLEVFINDRRYIDSKAQ